MPSRRSRTRLSLKQIWEQLRFGEIRFGKKSTCPPVLRKPAPCGGRPEAVARFVMCSAFYSPTGMPGNELLVEHFRSNVKNAWRQYRAVCRIEKPKRGRKTGMGR